MVSELAIKNRAVAINSVRILSLTTPGESLGKDRLDEELDLRSTSDRQISSSFYDRLFRRIYLG